MTAFIKALTLFLLFTVEVTVRAEEAKEYLGLRASYIDEPQECWQPELKGADREWCAIHVLDKKWQFKLEAWEASLAPQTTIIVSSSQELRHIQGSVWLKSQKEIVVKSVYGQLFVPGGSEVLLHHDPSRWVIWPIHQDIPATQIKLLARGQSESVSLLPGYEHQLSSLDRQVYEIPQLANVYVLLPLWAKLGASRGQVASYGQKWNQARKKVGVWHRSLASLEIEKHQEELARQRARQRRIQEENQRLRALFRQRNYLDFDPDTYFSPNDQE